MINNFSIRKNIFKSNLLHKKAFINARRLHDQPKDGIDLMNHTTEVLKQVTQTSLDSGTAALQTQPEALAEIVRSTTTLTNQHQEAILLVGALSIVVYGLYTAYKALNNIETLAQKGPPSNNLNEEELSIANKTAKEILEKNKLEEVVDNLGDRIDDVTNQLSEFTNGSREKLQNFPEELIPKMQEMHDAIDNFLDYYTHMMQNMDTQNFLIHHELFEIYSDNEFYFSSSLEHLTKALDTFNTVYFSIL